jgi:shikimate kinase
MPGCGKSSHGKKLAKQLQWDWIDLDSLIEANTGTSIAQIFETRGEKAFREIEQETLFKCNPISPTVIACGGGTPSYANNMDFINKNGLSIYLYANEHFLWHRLSAKNTIRPLFRGLSEEDCKIKIAKLLSERKYFYEQAHLHLKLPFTTSNMLLNSILSYIKPQ